MIQLTEELWIGNSADETFGELVKAEIGGVLNVAHDLKSKRSVFYPCEYMQVGLINGPGNRVGDYCAAVFCLRALVHRCDKVMVFDHEGCMALVVSLMYLNLKGGQWRPDPMAWSHWPTWTERFAESTKDIELPELKIDKAHVEAFNKLPWGLMEVM